jgi:hypothetical protein
MLLTTRESTEARTIAGAKAETIAGTIAGTSQNLCTSWNSSLLELLS